MLSQVISSHFTISTESFSFWEAAGAGEVLQRNPTVALQMEEMNQSPKKKYIYIYIIPPPNSNGLFSFYPLKWQFARNLTFMHSHIQESSDFVVQSHHVLTRRGGWPWQKPTSCGACLMPTSSAARISWWSERVESHSENDSTLWCYMYTHRRLYVFLQRES